MYKRRADLAVFNDRHADNLTLGAPHFDRQRGTVRALYVDRANVRYADSDFVVHITDYRPLAVAMIADEPPCYASGRGMGIALVDGFRAVITAGERYAHDPVTIVRPDVVRRWAEAVVIDTFTLGTCGLHVLANIVTPHRQRAAELAGDRLADARHELRRYCTVSHPPEVRLWIPRLPL